MGPSVVWMQRRPALLPGTKLVQQSLLLQDGDEVAVSGGELGVETDGLTVRSGRLLELADGHECGSKVVVCPDVLRFETGSSAE